MGGGFAEITNTVIVLEGRKEAEIKLQRRRREGHYNLRKRRQRESTAESLQSCW